MVPRSTPTMPPLMRCSPTCPTPSPRFLKLAYICTLDPSIRQHVRARHQRDPGLLLNAAQGYAVAFEGSHSFAPPIPPAHSRLLSVYSPTARPSATVQLGDSRGRFQACNGNPIKIPEPKFAVKKLPGEARTHKIRQIFKAFFAVSPPPPAEKWKLAANSSIFARPGPQNIQSYYISLELTPEALFTAFYARGEFRWKSAKGRKFAKRIRHAQNTNRYTGQNKLKCN